MGGFKELSIGILETIEEALEESIVDGMTVGETFVLKWQYDLHGHFFSALVRAICIADTKHRSRLMMGFPQEVEAMNKYWHVEGWWDELDEKAKAQEWGPFKSVQCTKENEDEE